MRHVDHVIVRTRKLKSKLMLMFATLILVGGGVVLPVATFGSASADHIANPVSFMQYTKQMFSPSYLSSWTQDRIFPSGDISSVDFAGRDNVLSMSTDTSKANASSFYDYEGIAHSLPGASAVTADLYVDGSWIGNSTTPVNAGLWGVGQDGSGNVSAYPILDFTNRGANNFTGWRTFNDNVGGWVNLQNVPYRVNSWNDLALVYNPKTTLFDLYVNGVKVGSSHATGSVSLSSVIFDNYNYGTQGSNYTVHWSDFAYSNSTTILNSPKQCKDGMWMGLGKPLMFSNQGQCVSSFEHSGYTNDNKPDHHSNQNQDVNKHHDN